VKASLNASAAAPRPTGKRLVSNEEARRLAARKRAGRIFAVLTFIPVVLAVALVIALLLDTLFDTVSWQIVEPSSSTSGQTFAWSEAPFGGLKVIRLDMAAQGLSQEESRAFFADAEELRLFEARSRVELMWRTEDGPFRWVVTNSRDDREADIGLFGINAYLRELRDELAEDDPEDLEPAEQQQLSRLQAANLDGFNGFANVGLLASTLTEDQNLYLNPWLDASFLTKNASRTPVVAGLKAAFLGTLWVMGLVILLTVPTGVGAAIYLEEYAPANRFSQLLEVNIRNLAGVPSIVYGILGLYVFVRLAHIGPTILSAALTLSLLVLPVVIIAARESIRAVPGTLRQASYGLGATKWQTVNQVVLPNAVGGIVTGVILAIARAIGETAPLLLVGAVGFIAYSPDGPFSRYTVIPSQIYNWISENDVEFAHVASAGIIVLLGILFILYGLAFYLRRRFERSW
jgi:phosphate transport system permease protein